MPRGLGERHLGRHRRERRRHDVVQVHRRLHPIPSGLTCASGRRLVEERVLNRDARVRPAVLEVLGEHDVTAEPRGARQDHRVPERDAEGRLCVDRRDDVVCRRRVHGPRCQVGDERARLGGRNRTAHLAREGDVELLQHLDADAAEAMQPEAARPRQPRARAARPPRGRTRRRARSCRRRPDGQRAWSSSRSPRLEAEVETRREECKLPTACRLVALVLFRLLFERLCHHPREADLPARRDDLRTTDELPRQVQRDVLGVHVGQCTTCLRGAVSRPQEHRALRQIAPHRSQEPRPVGTRRGAVVDGEVDGHDRAHDDLAAGTDRALDDAADGEDARLRRVDDRLEARDAEHAEVRDAERAALDLVLLAASPSARGRRGRARRRASSRSEQRVGVADHRHDQAVVERDRDADVRRAVLVELAVDPGAVELRVVAQRERAGAHDQVVDRELDALVGELGVELLAQRERLAHVDLALQVEVRHLRLRLAHAARDGAQHRARLDARSVGLAAARRRRARRAPARRPRRRRTVGVGRRAAGDRALDVDAHDAAVGPAALAGQARAGRSPRRRRCAARPGCALSSPPPAAARAGAARLRGRRRAAAAGSAAAARRRPAPPRRLRRLGRRRRRAPAEKPDASSPGSPITRDGSAQLGRLAVLHEDPQQHALGVGVELHRRLVGLDLGERRRPRAPRRPRARASGRSSPAPSCPTAAASQPLLPSYASCSNPHSASRPRAAFSILSSQRQRRELERLGVRHRRLGAADALDRRVEIVEALARDARRELGADAVGRPALLGDERAGGLGDARRRPSRRRAAAASAGRRPRPRCRAARGGRRPSARGARCSCARRSSGRAPRARPARARSAP